MTYREWFEAHGNKHKKIVDKLVAQGLNKDEIIEYFDFDNMVMKEKDFCYLYAENKKCHDMKNLNCYMCACPYFRFSDEGIAIIDGNTQYSYCSIEAKDGKLGVFGDTIHQDCSDCKVPHHVSYVKKHFDLDWKKIMHKSILEKEKN